MHVPKLLIYFLCLESLLDFGTDLWFSKAGALPSLSCIFTDTSTKGFSLQAGSFFFAVPMAKQVI